MISRYTYKSLIWVDLESPTSEEVRQVMEEFGLHPMVAEELIGPTVRPKVDVYDNLIYLILHFPAFRRRNRKKEIIQQEVDFVIGKHFIITGHYDTIDPLHQFSKVFEVNSILERSDIGVHAGYIFFYMVSRMYESLLHELEAQNDIIQEIENGIFRGQEKNMVRRLSDISRELLDFKRATSLHHEVLTSFEAAGRRFFGEEFNYYLRAITGEYYKVYNAIKSNSELIKELRETNDSLLNTKQNEIMKIITVVAFVTLPMSVITNFFQMSTVHTPIVGLPNDWLIIILLVFLLTLLLFAAAKFKRWF